MFSPSNICAGYTFKTAWHFSQGRLCPPHLTATQPILVEAYSKFRAAFFLFQTFLFPDCFQRIREKIIKVRPLCFCLATISVLFFGVFLKEAQLFAQKYPILFMEVSAFTGLNVDNLFSKIGTFTLNVLINMRYWPNVWSRWQNIGQVLFVSVNKNTQKTRPIFGHLDRTSLVNKGFITWRKKRTFTCGRNAENPQWASRVANAIFSSSCALAHSAIKKGGEMDRDVSFILLRQPLSVVCHSHRTFYYKF